MNHSRLEKLKPGDACKIVLNGEVHSAVVLWTYYDHMSVQVNGKPRYVSYEEAEFPPGSIAARAIARTAANALYPSDSKRSEATREDHVRTHWIDHYPAVRAAFQQWQERQIAPLEPEIEVFVRWVWTFDRHPGTEYQFRSRCMVAAVEELMPARRRIEREATTANWRLTRERTLIQSYRPPPGV